MGRLWLGALAFAVGVVMADRPGVQIAAMSLVAIIGMFLRPALMRLLVIVAIAACGGCLVGSIHARRAHGIEVLARSYPRCLLEGTISQRSGLGTLVRVRFLRCGDQVARAGEVHVDVAGELGSVIRARGWLLPLASTGSDALRARSGAAASFSAAHMEIGPPDGLFYRPAVPLRRALRDATADRRPVIAGLLRGLAIGETDLIPTSDSAALRRAGLSHLVAVSGTNVTIVLTAVAAVVGRVSRRMRLTACACALAFFVAIVGPDPSVLRAAAMGALGLIALLAGTRTQPLSLLALATMAVIAVRPAMVHAVGLHLSVAATAGICSWAARLERSIRIGPRWLRTAAAVTISAQVAVAPLLIGTFGEVSAAGLPANILAAPAVAPATVLGLAAALIGLVWDAGAEGVIALAAPCAEWIVLVGRALGAGDAATVELPRWAAGAAWVVVGLGFARAGLSGHRTVSHTSR